MFENLLAYRVSDEGVFAKNGNIFLPGLLKSAFDNGFADGNLWQNYLTYLILTDENFFSLSCERSCAPEGTLAEIGRHDLGIFMKLFTAKVPDYIRDFRNGNAKNEPVCSLSRNLAAAGTPDDFFSLVTGFYRSRGAGSLAFHRAFRFIGGKLEPVENVGDVSLNGIVGYEIQKGELVSNTEAFISGRPANNVLLYGDGGTGKSTSIKAILNAFSGRGLRVIEVYKHQLRDITSIVNSIRKRNYCFIIFIDDLSFEENESEYKYLKAIIEGGIETRPSNVLIYATSNRRHIVREIWSDRDDMEHSGDIHRSDTVEEKLSLASRFGIALNYSSPTRKVYHDIVLSLAESAGLNISEEELISGSDTWELRHGGMSGRAARQYIDYLSGRVGK